MLYTLYIGLYNSVISDDAVKDLLININTNINDESLGDIDKITENLIKEAIGHLKNNKSDVDHDWKSDAFINGVDALASPIAFIFKCFLIHGHISTVLLLCALVPLVKDKLGDKTSSSNYRAIAISSLFMKIFDWILLILFGENLTPSVHQFGFRKNSSTAMCSWVVNKLFYQQK